MKSKHPKGLPYLFFTEMWERFGYYLILGIFVLYMIDPKVRKEDWDSLIKWQMTFSGLILH